MGWNVHLHVSFNCSHNEGVAELARRHLSMLGDEYEKRQAKWYLSDLAQRKGTNPGPKGGLSLWGMVVSGSEAPHNFVHQLELFWRDLLGGGMGWEIDGGLCGHERIIVLYEEEQSGAANAYEIGWEDDWPEHWGDERPEIDDRILFIRHHGPLPFAWRQY